MDWVIEDGEILYLKSYSGKICSTDFEQATPHSLSLIVWRQSWIYFLQPDA